MDVLELSGLEIWRTKILKVKKFSAKSQYKNPTMGDNQEPSPAHNNSEQKDSEEEEDDDNIFELFVYKLHSPYVISLNV